MPYGRGTPSAPEIGVLSTPFPAIGRVAAGEVSDIDKPVQEGHGGWQAVGVSRRTNNDYKDCARALQDAARALPSASSMMRRMLRAQRPHFGLQPRQP
jgi:hypothetical protein